MERESCVRVTISKRGAGAYTFGAIWILMTVNYKVFVGWRTDITKLSQYFLRD
jgi:hypothetical protein